MKYFIKSMVLFIVVVIVSFCSSKKDIAVNLTQEIEYVYFQKWVGGQELSGSGIDFHLKFKNQLPKDNYLVKVYFQNQEAFFDKEGETAFIARFYSKSSYINDGKDKDSAPNKPQEDKNEIPDFPFDLKSTEAILEFHNNNKVKQVKIVNIKVKELVAYPSSKPRN